MPILELFMNAGTTDAEWEQWYSDPNGEVSDVVEAFEGPIYAGFAADGLTLPGLEVNRNNQVNTSYASWLVGADPVYSTMDLVALSIVRESESGATLQITLNLRDNFFSSGARDAESPTDTEFGRSADLDETIVQTVTVQVDGEHLKVTSITG